MDRSNPVNARLRQLPSTDELVNSAQDGEQLPRWALLAAARAVLEEQRGAILADPAAVEAVPEAGRDGLVAGVRERAAALARPAPRRVLNATGVVLHTNLGRAPLSPEAAAEVAATAAAYSDLELDLETGERGSRLSHVSELLCLASGAEAALVVNNNAAAVFLALDALAAGREVILSRGELVEIGGSFRIPSILAASRATLVEVGTTNRTHPSDYEDAIGPRTAALLKVHRSNFEVRGFTAEVSVRELALLARERSLPLIEDRGSGSFVDLRPHGLAEPPVPEGLREGADLVLFSGDKLLGGPQAGIVLGRRDLVERMKASPLARALRVDKMTLAALDWTLRAVLSGDAAERVPALRMLLASGEVLRARAQRLADAIAREVKAEVRVEARASLVGGGSLPGLELPGYVVQVTPSVKQAKRSGKAGDISVRLRRGAPAVLVRVHEGALLLDSRTLADDEVEACAAALGRAWFESQTSLR